MFTNIVVFVLGFIIGYYNLGGKIIQWIKNLIDKVRNNNSDNSQQTVIEEDKEEKQ